MKSKLPHRGAAWLLAAACITAPVLWADAPPVPPPPPDPAAVHAQVVAEVAHATELARQAQDVARQVVALAQARSAEAEDVTVLFDPPDPPEPPEAPEPPEPPDPSPFQTRLAAIVGDPFGGESGASTPLLVASKLDDDQRSQLTEDLKVMHRILEKAAERAGAGAGADTAMGIAVWSSFGRPATQTLYLDGFGAIFLLNVKYPLVAPPAREPAKDDSDKPDNSAWEDARRELYGQRDDGPRSRRADILMLQRYGVGTSERGVQYSGAKVEALKQALLEAAKNAANIRKLGPTDQVVIVAQGPGAPLVKNIEVNRRNAHERVIVSARGGGPRSTLVVRFKKADAEAFANGKLSLDEFTKQAEISTD